MKSPFPGMDPYLESHWGDVHHNIIGFIQEALNQQLPRRFVARAAERVYFEFDNDDDPKTECFLAIRSSPDLKNIITVLEALSPSNKRVGPGRTAYQKDRSKFLGGGASLVEIDFLRSGVRTLSIGPDRFPRRTYQVCVHRHGADSRVEVYPLAIQDRLPVIAVPLLDTEPDAIVDLQSVLDQCYRQGRYDNINYKLDPEPPLEQADAQWADELLRSQGVR